MSASTLQVKHGPISHLPEGDGRASAIGRALFRFPSLTTTVPKEFVHRAAVAEVLLTGWERKDDTRFRVTAQWPRGHSFFSPIDGTHYDPLLATETIRQVGSLLAHAEFDVPLTHHFLMRDLAYTVRPEQLRISGTPAGLDIDVTCTAIRRRGTKLAGLRYEAVLKRDGEVAATGSASYTCTTPEVYRRLRGDRTHCDDRPQLPLTAPVSPRSVGRLSPTDVVLSPTDAPHRWQLRVDTRHPTLFDHPVDHIPGMVLIEAARQGAVSALATWPLLPTGIQSEFRRYAELDSPCLIEARHVASATDSAAASASATASGDAHTVLVTGHQNGLPVFTSTVVTTPLPGH
ncbi:ScbA/BarX family gamma-butyrolactone biosynthesis protein [Streptomyces scopuliridis]|uniref:ScbA/BarX family gamma-butyrolactone biosynthesis protein n=1 Tax=Streptomyces scopuliridis TaxID=452529 RepID=UPI0035D90AE8